MVSRTTLLGSICALRTGSGALMRAKPHRRSRMNKMAGPMRNIHASG
jgi:hypothetical protein